MEYLHEIKNIEIKVNHNDINLMFTLLSFCKFDKLFMIKGTITEWFCLSSVESNYKNTCFPLTRSFQFI